MLRTVLWEAVCWLVTLASLLLMWSAWCYSRVHAARRRVMRDLARWEAEMPELAAMVRLRLPRQEARP